MGHHYAMCSAAPARPVYHQTLVPFYRHQSGNESYTVSAISHIWTGLPTYWVFIYCMGNFSNFPTCPSFSKLLSDYSQINLGDSIIKFSPCTVPILSFPCRSVLSCVQFWHQFLTIMTINFKKLLPVSSKRAGKTIQDHSPILPLQFRSVENQRLPNNLSPCIIQDTWQILEAEWNWRKISWIMDFSYIV